MGSVTRVLCVVSVSGLLVNLKYVSNVIDMSTPANLNNEEVESYLLEKNVGYSFRFKRQAENCTCKCAKKKNKCRGKRGKRGPRGFKGFKGIQGQKGEQGIPGMVGPPGRPGYKGDRGNPGHPGQNGMHGRDGRQGLQGEQGQTGAAGPKGRSGKDGEKGEKGQWGVPGSNGIPGNQGYPGVKGDTGNAGRPELNVENWAAHLEQRGPLSSTGHRNGDKYPFIKTWNGRYYTENNVYETIVSNQILGFLQNSSLPSDVKSPVEYQRNGTHRVLLDGLYLLYMNIMTTAEMHIGLYIDVNIGLLCHTSSSVSVKQSEHCKDCLQQIANVKSCSAMGLFHVKKGQHIYLKISEGRKSVLVQDTNFGVLLLLRT